MARIRTIKPEFWTSEQVAECSPNARLLFIGMWNFCDDQGIHPASLKTLKMQIFPGDSFTLSDIENMVIELMHHKLLFFYQHEGKNFWFVTGWNHQKIDKPNKKYPLPDAATLRVFLADNSANGSRTIADHLPEEGKGREGKGEERIQPPRVSDIEALYRKYAGVNMTGGGQVVVLQDFAKAYTLETIEEAFKAAAASQIPTRTFLNWCSKRMERIAEKEETPTMEDWMRGVKL